MPHRTEAIPSRVGVRRRMPARTFAVPETRGYPIPDPYHAELALTALLRVVGRHGVTPEGKRTAKIPIEFSGKTWKKFIGEACPHGLKIALVDGTYVRNHFDSDFSQGGNGFRYPRFISRKEIWIDSEIHKDEWPFIAFHECQEVERMREGLDYEHAHDQAKRLEDSFRHHHPKGLAMAKKTASKKTSKKQPKLRGKTRDLASKYIAEEMHTKKYPRAQAIAIGISRARTQAKKTAHKKRIQAIIDKHS